ncbi:MAG: hypothetical protein FJX80_00500 [Bacteroidetes bacterium]|nr:hypothetical protein [Bacteroidota bacterium]
MSNESLDRVDLGHIFKPKISEKGDDVNFKSKGYRSGGMTTTILNENTVDISNFYEKSAGNGSENADQITYDTNYKINNVDLRYYFKKK